MTPFGLPRDEAWSLLGHLLAPAARTLVLAGAMGMVLTVLRVSRATIRLFAWTIILYAALAMPLLGWLMPGLRWSLPGVATDYVSLVAEPGPEAAGASVTGVRTLRARSLPSAPRDAIVSAPAVPAFSLPSIQPMSQPAHEARYHFISWEVMVPAIYLAGLLVLLLRGGLGWMMAHRLEGLANPVSDTDVLERLRFHGRASGSRRLPRLAEAEAVFAPLTLSVVRPVIVLPTNWRQWSAAKLNAVLAHELAHVARGDAFTLRLSLLHRAVFWFSPLSWWLHYHLGELAEQASDEAALDAGADQTTYAETLLSFFAEIRGEIPTSTRRVRWQALAMARGSGSERRVEHILAWKGGMSTRLTKSAVLTLVLAATPVVLLTASVRPAIRSARAAAPQLIRSVPVAESAIPSTSSLPAVQSTIAQPAGDNSQKTPLLGVPALSNGLASVPALSETQAKTGQCESTRLARCQFLDVKQLEWLIPFAGRPTFDVTSDKRFHSLVQVATPKTIFHLGYDMPLAQAIESMLGGPSFAVELRDGQLDGWPARYLMISAQRSERGIGQSFYWFDLQQGLTFGGIFFNPSNGEPTPTLTIFSNQIGDRVTKASQLPSAFLQDLENWRAARNVPSVTVRYFINASGWKSVLMHDNDACVAANDSLVNDPSQCQTTNEAAAELDMEAALYLLRIHYAQGSPARTQLEAAQQQWDASQQNACEGQSNSSVCRTKFTRARAQELSNVYSKRGTETQPVVY